VEALWVACSFGLPAYEAVIFPGAVVWDYEKDYLDPEQGDSRRQGQFWEAALKVRYSIRDTVVCIALEQYARTLNSGD